MKTAVVICCTVMCLIACKKHSESKSKSELLTNGSWHVTAYTVDPAIDFDGDGNDETNVYAVMEQCIKDDHTTFFADGTAQLDEGATKCSPGDAQTTSLTWSISEDEKKLEVQGIEYLIESLTENQMVLKEIEVISAVTVTHTVTFSHL
jgi:hypothetical protein